ncbi:MAG: hypothetical protein OHK0056_16660 [Bacteriovoracaceae bacterium]
MSDFVRKYLKPSLPEEHLDKVFEYFRSIYPDGEDPWGLNLKKTRKSIEYIWPIYKNYFKTRVFGKENVQDKPYIVISNHTGQIAIDGMLICTAFATEIDPPRILRSMVERFFTAIPFIGTWAAEGGAVLGDRQNCLNLLQRGQSILAFPEGVKGIAKSTPDYYQLQRFTRGFFRMAMTAGVDILPCAVIGAEEMFPWVYQAKGFAKMFGLPAAPLSPHYFPLPSPVDIHIGQAYQIPHDLSPEAPDELIDPHVEKIKDQVQEMIKKGLESRRPFFANVYGSKK